MLVGTTDSNLQFGEARRLPEIVVHAAIYQFERSRPPVIIGHNHNRHFRISNFIVEAELFFRGAVAGIEIQNQHVASFLFEELFDALLSRFNHYLEFSSEGWCKQMLKL